MCSVHCYEHRATYMATQWGYECWCSRNPGLDFVRHTMDEEGDTGLCDMPCMGDEVTRCEIVNGANERVPLMHSTGHAYGTHHVHHSSANPMPDTPYAYNLSS